MKLTLQLFNDGEWCDTASLELSKTNHLKARISYHDDYCLNKVSDYGCIDNRACSVNAPVEVIPTDYEKWPALLDDLMPVGKSRTWWLKRLNASGESTLNQNIKLLENACGSPVGNLRVKNTDKSDTHIQYFNIDEVTSLQYDFLEYANEQGATVGGATGAGGVAPKLLLMLDIDNNKVHIDSDFAGKPLTSTPYLTKFARNNRSKIDNDILSAEGKYYILLDEMLSDLNIDTIDSSKILIKEHDGQVSLWLPRFDVIEVNGIAQRVGMESIYSIVNAEPGSYQNHFNIINEIWNKIKNSTTMSSAEFVQQYVVRDFLNIVFGNSDNHGRNISFMKKRNDIIFSPIYDFAPMKADPEGVTRIFKWGTDFERGGNVDFRKVSLELSDLCDPKILMDYLQTVTNRLGALKERLIALGCPTSITENPSIAFDYLANKIFNMGLNNEGI